MFFRAVNAEIARLDGTIGAEFICECGNPLCAETITLPPESLKMLHAQADRFVVLDGHELPDVESVVGRMNGYVIIEKKTSTST